MARHTHRGDIPYNEGERTRLGQCEETQPHSKVTTEHARPCTDPGVGWIRGDKMVGGRGIHSSPRNEDSHW